MNNIALEMEKKHGEDSVFNFTLGNPRVPPPKEYLDALIEVAADEKPLCHGYSSTMGDEEARESFAKLFTEIQGVKVGPEDVIVTSGCAGAINVFLRCVMAVGDDVIVVSPYFLEYPYYIENWHGTYTVLETTFEEKWQINPDKLEACITPLTRAIIINSPNNPTGCVYTQDTIDKMCDVLKKKSREYGRPIYVLSDDVYYRVLRPGVKCHKIFDKYPHSVIAYSLSKDLSLAGERIGCLVVNPLLKNKDLLVHSCAHANEIMGFVHANRIHMRIIPKVLPATSNLNAYTESCDIICKLLDELGVEYIKPDGAFYVFPKIPHGIDDMEFCECMANNFIILVPGSAFAMPGFFRLSFCKPPEDIKDCIPVFKKAFQKAMELKKK